MLVCAIVLIQFSDVFYRNAVKPEQLRNKLKLYKKGKKMKSKVKIKEKWK